MLGAQTPDFRQNPVGGSQWIGNKLESLGLLRPSTGTPQETFGRLGGGLLSSPQAIGRTALALEQAARNAQIPGPFTTGPIAGQIGATVYHGSPHKFDKFDMSKIGTGEGAQAYGRGLYFADRPEVSRAYAQNLPGSRPTVSLSTGQTFAYGTPQADALLGTEFSTVGEARKRFLEMQREFSDGRYDYLLDAVKDLPSNAKINRGNLYKVDLPDEQISRMMDWDKPLSAQGEYARNVLKKIDNPVVRQAIESDWTGHKLMKTLEDSMSVERPVRGLLPGVTEKVGGSEAAAQLLRSAGIPGIKYLDAGSRGAGTGTRNYVVFDDSLLNILGRE